MSTVADSNYDLALRDLAQNGFCSFDEFFSGQETSELRAKLDWAISPPFPLGDAAYGMDRGSAQQGEKVPQKIIDAALHDPFFMKLAHHPRILDFVELALGPVIRLNTSTVWLKPPNIGATMEAHQDAAHWKHIQPPRYLTVWIAVDESTLDNGCLHFKRGSHSHGIYPHSLLDNQYCISDPGVVGGESIAVPLPAGGCSFHLGTTVHWSGPNRTQDHRRGAAFTYFSGSSSVADWAEKQHPFPYVRGGPSAPD
ncbi:phytanoyl-CoA dioxygenase family protein [Streptomyces sp. NPDC093108]|uniref:phytanoyl-CoA dioxygenase family protein n=1 Tax=Streptomyces sp. NPDC093108 TaxID=3366030 RepID=UPI003815E313